jgi:VanZ family protein
MTAAAASADRHQRAGLRQVVGLWLPVILWMAVIFFFSSLSTLPQAPSSFLDTLLKKSLHFGEYAVLALLAYRALGGVASPRRWPMLAAVAIAVLYATTDEFHQTLVPGRHPAFSDVLIDTAGSVAATLWVRIFRV